MKKIWLLFGMFSYLATLSAIEQPLPNTAREAFDNHLKTIRKFVDTNEQELKTALRITGSSLKILGAFLLFTGTHNLTKDLLNIARPGRFKQPIRLKHITSPRVWADDLNDSQSNIILPISSPPYLTALLISAYLLGTGSYELYQEYKKYNSSPAADVQPMIVPIQEEKQEKELSASDTISQEEIKSHLPQPDDANNRDRPRLHPYNPRS